MDFVEGALRDQEYALRQLVADFSRICRRAEALGSGPDWFGPASAAYDASVTALRIELQLGQARLADALHDTGWAVSQLNRRDDSVG